MEIRTKKELKFYILADRMMNRGCFKYSFKTRLYRIFLPDYVMEYLEVMRKLSFYSHQQGLLNAFLKVIYLIRYHRLGVKLSFNIGYDTCGYGLVIPHYGSLGIGPSNRLGNYCVIHTLTSITDNGKVIGNGFYLSKGAIVTSSVTLGNSVMVGANSVVNKSYIDDNIMLAGAPATIIKTSEAWYRRQGAENYSNRVVSVEELRRKMDME